ncbi:hypothetical protein T310_10289, partial [Rasamsonia emersonii CBS 393.64]
DIRTENRTCTSYVHNGDVCLFLCVSSLYIYPEDDHCLFLRVNGVSNGYAMLPWSFVGREDIRNSTHICRDVYRYSGPNSEEIILSELFRDSCEIDGVSMASCSSFARSVSSQSRFDCHDPVSTPEYGRECAVFIVPPAPRTYAHYRQSSASRTCCSSYQTGLPR